MFIANECMFFCDVFWKDNSIMKKLAVIVVLIILLTLGVLLAANLIIEKNEIRVHVEAAILVASVISVYILIYKKCVIGYASIVKSINELQKELESPLVITNSDNKIISVNNVALGVTGYKEEEILGLDIKEICSESIEDDKTYMRNKKGTIEPIEISVWDIGSGSMKVKLFLGNTGICSNSFMSMLDCYSIGVLEVDRTGKIYLGYGSIISIFELDGIYKNTNDLINRNVYDIASFDKTVLEEEIKNEYLQKEIVIETLRGNKRLISACIAKLNDSRLMLVLRDMTSMQYKREEEKHYIKKYRAITSVAPIGIIVIDKDMVIKEFNSYIASIMGSKSTDEFINKKIYSIMGLTEAGVIEDIKAVIDDEMPVSNKNTVMTEYGKTIELSYIISPIKDNSNKIVEVMLLAEDLTRKEH